MLRDFQLILICCVFAAADIDEVEAQWKTQFHEWNTRYIVDWKAQFDRYVRQTRKLQAHSLFAHEDLWEGLARIATVLRFCNGSPVLRR